MDIIHIHGFKCAGTTLEKILFREYPDLLRVENSHGGKRLFYEDISPELLSVGAISSHLLAPQKESSSLQISLIRDPYKRLVSAWKFQKNIVKDIDETFREHIDKYKNSVISNYQCKLLSLQNKGAHFNSGWNFNLDLDFIFGDSFFLGVVERFDESMVLLEHRLDKRGIQIDLSYPSIQNSTKDVKQKKELNDFSKFAYPSTDADTWLWKMANDKMDYQIRKIPSFNDKLKNYKERCENSIFPKKNLNVVKI